MKFEAYKHVNGNIIIKRYFPEIGLKIDQSSPNIEKYLGVIESDNYTNAVNEFNNIV